MILSIQSSSSSSWIIQRRAIQLVLIAAVLSSALTWSPAKNVITRKSHHVNDFGRESCRERSMQINLLRGTVYEEDSAHGTRECLRIFDRSRASNRSPRNLVSKTVSAEPSQYLAEWGVEHEGGGHSFPDTPEKLVGQAFDAIAATIYHSQKNDPNIANNARSTSLFTTRPVRKKTDCGRIGLEIDGAKFLFSRGVGLSSGAALRRIALMLAAKLASDRSWRAYEKKKKNKKKKEVSPEHNDDGGDGHRPVVLYFNTIKQALAASQDLKWLKRTAKDGYAPGIDPRCLKMITIQCLTDDIPEHMRLDRKTHRRRHGGLANGIVDATKGIAMVVQPSNFNDEYKPPGPALGTVSDFQRLASQASVEELPFIVLSPRFVSGPLPTPGWDQSGYQKSATYGGAEPPKGPTPWIMRDFTPPAYCWVVKPMKHPLSSEEEGRGESSLLKVAMTQSVTEVGHQWHIYTNNEDFSRGSLTQASRPVKYHYLASTRSSAGRPTRSILSEILCNF